MSRWFVSPTFVICVYNFPRREVSVKVGVMEFGLKTAADTTRPRIVHCAMCLLTFSFYARKQLLLSARLSHRNSVRLSVRPSVRLSVTRVDQAKTVQARISKSSPSAARKTPVSGTVKLFHKFEGGHPEREP